MKFRKTVAELERAAERELEDQIRAENRGGGLPEVPREFWSSLRVRTNERIDLASSGRAITLSWAARVAIPGVVALLSFLVGLHYYAPLPSSASSSLAGVLDEFPPQAIDSLMWSYATGGDSIDADIVYPAVFEAESDEIATYLVDAGTTVDVSEFLDEQDVDRILQSMTKQARRVH